jgi:hypothetical protein
MKPSRITNTGLYILLILMFLAIITCEKDDNDLPFSFDYSTTDINGNRKSTFIEGENIIFSFKIINHTDEDFIFFPYYLDSSNIFKIYKRSDDSDLDYIGSPAKAVICEFGPSGIPANGLFDLSVPLYDAKTIGYSVCKAFDSLFITTGNYESSFSYSFKLSNLYNSEEEYITDILDFKLVFKVNK